MAVVSLFTNLFMDIKKKMRSFLQGLRTKGILNSLITFFVYVTFKESCIFLCSLANQLNDTKLKTLLSAQLFFFLFLRARQLGDDVITIAIDASGVQRVPQKLSG